MDLRNDVKSVQNSSGTTSRRGVVSLQSLGRFDLISKADKSKDHGKLLSIFFFTITMESFDVHSR